MSDALSSVSSSQREASLPSSSTTGQRSQSDFYGRSVDSVTPFVMSRDFSYLTSQRERGTPSGLSLALSHRSASQRSSIHAPDYHAKSHSSFNVAPASKAPALRFPADDRALAVLYKAFPGHRPTSIPKSFEVSAELVQHYTSLTQLNRRVNYILENTSLENRAIFNVLRNICNIIDEISSDDSYIDVKSELNGLEKALSDLLRHGSNDIAVIEKAAKTSKENLKSAQSYIHTFISQNERCIGLYSGLIDAIVAAQSYQATICPSSSGQATASTPIPIPFQNAYENEFKAEYAINLLSHTLRDDRVFFEANTNGAEILTALVEQATADIRGLLADAQAKPDAA